SSDVCSSDLGVPIAVGDRTDGRSRVGPSHRYNIQVARSLWVEVGNPDGGVGRLDGAGPRVALHERRTAPDRNGRVVRVPVTSIRSRTGCWVNSTKIKPHSR